MNTNLFITTVTVLFLPSADTVYTFKDRLK